MSTSGDPRDGGQYPPPGGYEQNPAGPQRRPRNGLGIAALVLGLLALVLSWTIIGGIVLGLLALVFGLLGRARVKRGEATNGGLPVAGIVLGSIGLLIAIGIVAFGVSILNSPAGRSYQQCLEQSGGDPVRIQQCASEFGRQVGGG
ncbi:MAG: DUF4190 domain-containing protein [Actinomycetota bacterium]|nr:DUF4190 domain-containing protein [Actinomycetota bacterium]